MTYINPLAAALLPSVTVQQQAAVDKARQVRRAQAAARNVAAADVFEHEVENAEGVAAIHDEDPKREQEGDRDRQRQSSGEETDADQPRLDLRA